MVADNSETDAAERRRAYQHDYYLRNRERIRAKFQVNRDERLARRRVQSRNINQRLKLRVYEAYGNRCVCCGEDNLGFLSIDHINGGGRAHRQEVGGGVQLWRLIVKAGFPDDFQLLCYNCNLGRYHNGGTCPHKDQASVAA
jgi:hypothetical protein